jgi:hypothetical protein
VERSIFPTARGVVRGLLRGSALVAVTTGASVVARGSTAVPGGGTVSPSTDSVLRFYATWWAGAGALMWTVGGAPERHPGAVRAVAAVTFADGIARLLAMRSSRAPHPLFQVLTIVELVAPPVLLAAPRRLQPRGRRASPGFLSARRPRHAECRSLPSAVSTR